MYCFHPIVVKDKKFEHKERQVPCGKCPACRRAYQLQWIIRLKEELKHSAAGYFVTLTYEDSQQPGFDKKRVQKFLNRLQHRTKYYGVKLKYFLISEYGDTTGRPHHHALFFLDKYLDNFSEYIRKGWTFGFIQVADINARRINYVTKYCLKKQGASAVDWSLFPDELNPNKCKFISKGLGLGYLSPSIQAYHKNGLVTRYQSDLMYAQLPRYYKDKLFDEDELERIKLTNRCYVRAQQAKLLRRFGLKQVSSLDGRKYIVPDERRFEAYDPDGLLKHQLIERKKKAA